MRRASRRELEGMVGYHDLLADLRRPGCAICHGSDRSAWRYIDGLLWESVNDPGIRATLRAAHGFCREHSMMALRVASAHAGGLGMAILFEDLLRHVLAEAEHEAASGATGSRRRRRRPLGPHAPCPACLSARRTVESYVQILAAAHAGTVPFAAAREPGRGICLPHFAEGLTLLEEPAERDRYLDVFRHGSEELRGELREFSRKQDYRFQHEGLTDAEATAWRRGVYRLVGEPIPNREPPR